jgi:hypothetical protein
VTPFDCNLNSGMPSIESGYTETPRAAHQHPPMGNSQGSSLSKEDSPHSPPLSRPPSLIEQNDDDEIINSIKLNANSIYSSNQPSKVNRLSQSIEIAETAGAEEPIIPEKEEEEEDDMLGGINLTGMSKISRERQKESGLHAQMQDIE